MSSLAVDGNTNINFGAGSCAATTHEGNSGNPWWAVDLGNVYLVEKVTLFNREDCCGLFSWHVIECVVLGPLVCKYWCKYAVKKQCKQLIGPTLYLLSYYTTSSIKFCIKP
jgi:hypothetical protein